MELTKMKTRNVLNTVAHTLPDWHVVNDRQFGRITAYDPKHDTRLPSTFPTATLSASSARSTS